MKLKIAGLSIIDSVKEPQKVCGLKVDAAYWDLPCLECGLPMLRMLHVQFPILDRCPTQSRCKNCESGHIIELLRKGLKTFQVLVVRDYEEENTALDSPLFQLEPVRYFQTQWKRRKPTTQEVEHAFAKSKGRCQGCDCKIMLANYGTHWHVDHNIPLSRQGDNELKNLLALCDFCNRSKHDCTLKEFKAGKRYRRGSELW